MCNGSGILRDELIDVDHSILVMCPGCYGCEETEEDFAPSCEMTADLWVGMEVYPPRRSPLPELPAGFKFISFPKEAA